MLKCCLKSLFSNYLLYHHKLQGAVKARFKRRHTLLSHISKNSAMLMKDESSLTSSFYMAEVAGAELVAFLQVAQWTAPKLGL